MVGEVARWAASQFFRNCEEHVLSFTSLFNQHLRFILLTLLCLFVYLTQGRAEDVLITPDKALQTIVDGAHPGDILKLGSGTFHGPIVISKPLTLIGQSGSLIQGKGHGSVITITAPDVHIEGVTIKGSGMDLPKMDSAILVLRTGERAVIVANRMENNLFGVYLHGAAGSLVKGNTIIGQSNMRMSEAGNGVSIWNAPGAQIIDNSVRFGRDGIFVTTSKQNVFRGNSFEDLRFAIHYMYTNDSQIIGNKSKNNHIGLAIMYSDNLLIRDNVSIYDRDHGLMLNYANNSTITENVVQNGKTKCVFVYNANKNIITHNRFESCPIGIHFTAGSERNDVSGNAFINNRTQVKYVGTRFLDWGKSGQGNYWSDNPAFDLDGNGIADRPYRPNGVMDHILWKYPQAKILANSPAVMLIRWAQERFPAILPGGVIDTSPLMSPPNVAMAEQMKRVEP
jgi:nitrous oxidase accessory protein